MAGQAALPYHEPGIVVILTLSSFVLLLNAINYILDRLIFCGLIGQIFVGVAYGRPGADLLASDSQDFVQQFGYLGLILLVYEGGLSTNLRALKANLTLSSAVACIGIGCPIALSFALQGLLGVTPLQAFAAGAALCSTSLGTTFTVLSTSGLTESRLGIILTSAAMMDDVIGLVMVQVISNLGQDNNFSYVTVVRPLGVSLAFATVLPLICRYLIEPVAVHIWSTGAYAKVKPFLQTRHAIFVVHTALLLGLVTGATFAGTSGLFAAYLAGVMIVWWDGLKLEERMGSGSARTRPNSTSVDVRSDAPTQSETDQVAVPPKSFGKRTDPSSVVNSSRTEQTPPNLTMKVHGLAIFHHYYKPAVDSILKPFFFASIGFSIPITRMFSSQTVWRGFIYAVLMLFAKLLCGTCLIRFELPRMTWPRKLFTFSNHMTRCWKSPPRSSTSSTRRPIPRQTQSTQSTSLQDTASTTAAAAASRSKKETKKPLSLYPAAILGSAMVARGEIGFLISSVAESNGIFRDSQSASSRSSSRTGRSVSDGASRSESGSSELFLVVTWAILLCTIIGPVTVGLLVKRVKRLQDAERRKKTGRADPLGVWGVVSVKA